MKRRGFLGTFAAFLAAPLACLKKREVKETCEVGKELVWRSFDGDKGTPSGIRPCKFRGKECYLVDSLNWPNQQSECSPHFLEDQLTELKVKQTKLLSKWGVA